VSMGLSASCQRGMGACGKRDDAGPVSGIYRKTAGGSGSLVEQSMEVADEAEWKKKKGDTNQNLQQTHPHK